MKFEIIIYMPGIGVETITFYDVPGVKNIAEISGSKIRIEYNPKEGHRELARKILEAIKVYKP